MPSKLEVVEEPQQARQEEGDLDDLVTAGLLLPHEAEALRPLNSKPQVIWSWMALFWTKVLSGETAGGRGYASDYYEEQIYHDLGMELPSRSLALLRLQHDEEYYRAAAESFEALARGGRRASAGAPRGEV